MVTRKFKFFLSLGLILDEGFNPEANNIDKFIYEQIFDKKFGENDLEDQDNDDTLLAERLFGSIDK
eukprot:CAMPEP_0176345236 /NCGR_PEP_ID=MMETSP0126-20121128/5299_1 /TAXON_ID=141414 ORGANISM="Strombidinopsis acuminatum, Strain SPMC142" /NCGR_SAMPLE_ID=MMETSP0126 /ASSEMBLY_ACC=CAM_ASM_000229 /LENGTH=65 /DNA_ID=CAMNT_0017692097 /DNA_START=267 /DNA_END=465 /DNA_ORIENTATION=+